jgi:hypothetical protein
VYQLLVPRDGACQGILRRYRELVPVVVKEFMPLLFSAARCDEDIVASAASGRDLRSVVLQVLSEIVSRIDITSAAGSLPRWC